MVNNKVSNVTIVNQGSINGKVSGIKSQGTIDSILNSGTISGGSHYGVYVNGGSVESIENQKDGVIQGNKSGIHLDNQAKISSVVNKGTIVTTSASGVGLYEAGAGINVITWGTSIKTIDNQGLILTSNAGIGVLSSATNGDSNVETLKNSGTIEYTGSLDMINEKNEGFGQGAGIYISNMDGIPKINTIENSGLINTYNGMYFSLGSQVENINNLGTIHAIKDGIVLGNDVGSNEKRQTEIKHINNTGSIIAGRHGIFIDKSSNQEVPFYINTIENKGTILGQSGAGIFISAPKEHIKDYVKLDGSNSLIAGGTAGIHNKGTIGTNNNGASVNNGNVIDLQNGATIAALSPNKDGSFNYNLAGDAILNEGTIKGNINLDKEANIYGAINNKNTITGNISLNNNSYASSIKNEKEIQGSINLKNDSHIDSIINSGTISQGISLDKSTIGSIENSGTIGNGGIKLYNESQVSSITNNEGAKADLDLKNNSVVDLVINNGQMEITKDDTSHINAFGNNGNLQSKFKNEGEMKLLENSKDAILEQGLENTGSIEIINNAGTITSITNTFNNKTKDTKENSTIGTIINTGIIGNEATPLATQDITYGINNSGTIEKLINSSGDLSDPNAGKNIHIYGGINNSGYMDIFNTGNIHGGITNSGTLIVSNGHIHPATANEEATWHAGFIGKNNNGYQLENNGQGKISIDGWYFKDLEYTQSNEQRLENSIIIGGDNIGGISADKIYVNTSKLQLNTIYDANTFFADKDGNIAGDKTNNGAGVDGNNIYSLSGIYDFVGLGNGKYVANVNLSELSGKTLAKSMVYSSRLRNINISNILRDLNTKNFQTEFSQTLDMQLSKAGEAYGNDADLLAELEDIFIPNKNPNAKNHSFLLPYYNHSSIKIGRSIGQLDVDTVGMIGGSFRELPNDYGIIGFYAGYEDASKEQNTQRIKFDDKTYYGGLTYYGILARDGINQYYISASTRLDYTKSDIEKSYKNIPTTIDSEAKTYGYGVDVKLGANYYNTLDIARISPEIGLSYYGMSNKNFSLRHIDGLREHYLAEQFNFIDASAALKWYKPWSDKIRSNVTIGAIVNLYEDAKGNLKLGQNTLSSDIETSKYYGFGQLGFSYAIADNADLSLNYAGAFTFDNTTSHTMFLKLGMWW
ncbi:hypothetical protein CD56_05090 [Campylobacter lari]|nr:autotransporter outer membrane beta-barrel domain-containing protein [Campylobacter lari]AKJ53722.1 hypothetical protein CD56_05090 [Campylobacter lari]